MSVKIGVVGMGFGKHHVFNLQRIAGAQVVAIADLNIDKAREIASPIGAVAFPTWHELLESTPDLDAVILATPASMREAPIRAICERKLALFCEKPPALDVETARSIQGIIEESGVLNTVGFMYRWNPLATKLREIVKSHQLLFARIVVAWPILHRAVQGTAPRSLFTKAGCGGPLIEQAIHFQDALRYITGDEPVRVQGIAEQGSIIPGEGRDCEETTALVLRHASGMLSNHAHNWSHQGMLIQLQVVGEKLDLTLQMEGDLWLRGTVGSEVFDQQWQGDNYHEEMIGFVEAVTHNDQSLLRSSYADACRSLKVCSAAAKAVLTGTTEKILYDL